MPWIGIATTAALITIGMSTPAYAYVDPGSGSIIASAIIGFFAAIAYSCRKSFYRIKDRLFGKSTKQSTNKRDDF